MENVVEVRIVPANSVARAQSLSASSRITPVDDEDLSTSPMSHAISSMQKKLQDVSHFTVLSPQESWLPITESRNGNAFYAAFHTLCSGIGSQALVLPLAFVSLGWAWGIITLSVFFIWQLYTLWLLIQLHESESGMRYSRYIRLAVTAFGEKLGKLLVLFPTIYLSSGTCVTMIIIGGGTMKTFFKLLCGSSCSLKPLSAVEWYLIFTCCAIIISQLPNLNSIAGISLIGAITSVTYCTLIWVLSVTKDRPTGISYHRPETTSEISKICSILNALGIIVFAFRGHNVVLEIQGTMPSSTQKPSRVPMWRGVMFAYLVIAICLFPLAIGGYWAYGIMMPTSGGMLRALTQYHGEDTSKFLLGMTTFLVIISSLSSFQIYGMVVFDNLEFSYTSKKKKPCPRWLRSGFRVFYGSLAFFIASAFPFLPSLAGLIGGIALPVTLAYPSFIWIVIKKPAKFGPVWMLNWGLGCFGMVLSTLLVPAAIWTIVTKGLRANFFNP